MKKIGRRPTDDQLLEGGGSGGGSGGGRGRYSSSKPLKGDPVVLMVALSKAKPVGR